MDHVFALEFRYRQLTTSTDICDFHSYSSKRAEKHPIIFLIYCLIAKGKYLAIERSPHCGIPPVNLVELRFPART